MPDITISNTIPEVHQPKVLDAFNALAGNDIFVRWAAEAKSIRIPVKQEEETMKEYVERVNRRILWGVLQMVDYEVKVTEQRESDMARPPIESDIPEDAITATP